jgi:hypothetical protein
MRTALITGGSSGIGYELAKLFARDGYRLILVARNADDLAARAAELTQAFGRPVVTLSCDLARAEGPETLVERLRRDGLGVDVLVNSAGFATHGPFAQADPAVQAEMLQLNVASVVHLTRLLLPPMIARGWGRVLNLASTAAFQPGPLMAGYYASKAYVLSFSEALANELRGTGVAVTALCPGPTKTNFQIRAGLKRARLVRAGMMDAPAVARIGYNGLMAGKPVVIPGARNRLLSVVVRLAPRAWVTRIVRRIQEERAAGPEA